MAKNPKYDEKIQETQSPFDQAVNDLKRVKEIRKNSNTRYSAVNTASEEFNDINAQIKDAQKEFEKADRLRSKAGSKLRWLEDRRDGRIGKIRDGILVEARKSESQLTVPHLKGIRRLMELAFPAGEFGEWKIGSGDRKNMICFELPRDKFKDERPLSQAVRDAYIEINSYYDVNDVTGFSISPGVIPLEKLFDVTAKKLFENKYGQAPTESAADTEDMRRIREGLEANFAKPEHGAAR